MINENVFTVEEPIALDDDAKPIEYIITETGCHECVSHFLDKDNYPRVARGGTPWRMSRYIYHIKKGEIPKSLCVRHTCDNPKCINPEHLCLGTIAENNKDMFLRGRNAKGERHGNAKLNDEKVRAIRNSKLSISEIADKFGVSLYTIQKVTKRMTWKHVA